MLQMLLQHYLQLVRHWLMNRILSPVGWLRSRAFRGRDLPTSGPDIESWGRRLRRFAARLSIVLAVSVGCLSPVVAHPPLFPR